jgi:hypothetical protein
MQNRTLISTEYTIVLTCITQNEHMQCSQIGPIVFFHSIKYNTKCISLKIHGT